jgi:hypothetical protein
MQKKMGADQFEGTWLKFVWALVLGGKTYNQRSAPIVYLRGC